jgi:hypothetical protein
LDLIDIDEDNIIDQTGSMAGVLREPDGVVWIGDTEFFATANEGDLDGGSRSFSVFHKDGEIVFDSGNDLEHLVASVGHYPDERSGNRGNEPENVAYGEFGGGMKRLFVNSERSSLTFVYDMDDPENPEFLQLLPAGSRPEGATTIPSRGLFVSASEVDNREDKIRSVINIYELQGGRGVRVEYPTLESVCRSDETPIPFGALSGLVAGKKKNTLYAVEDSFYKSSRIFTIETKEYPAVLTEELRIRDTDGVFAAVQTDSSFSEIDLKEMINDDGTVNLDPEGIALTEDGKYFLIASEGDGNFGDGDEDRPVKSLNFLFKVQKLDGVIKQVITLPNDVNGLQLRYGFEGVAVQGDYAVVAFQRAWEGEAFPRLGIYNMATNLWKFVFYPVDDPESQYNGWVGLSDISALGSPGDFLVLERDNQGGPDAMIKRIYKIELGDLAAIVVEEVVEKYLIRDLLPDLKKPGGLVYEKVEGMAVMENGVVWIVNDNDGVDDNSGEIQLMELETKYLF